MYVICSSVNGVSRVVNPGDEIALLTGNVLSLPAAPSGPQPPWAQAW